MILTSIWVFFSDATSDGFKKTSHIMYMDAECARPFLDVWHFCLNVERALGVRAWFKTGSGTVVQSTLRAVPATVPDPVLKHGAGFGPGSKRGQAPLCKAPFGPFRQRSQTPI